MAAKAFVIPDNFVNTPTEGYHAELLSSNFAGNPFYTHQWQSAGGGKTPKKYPHISLRHHYVCSSSRLKNEAVECEAKLVVDHYYNDIRQGYRLITPHSEACDQREKHFRCQPKIVADAKVALRAGATPRGVVTDASVSTPSNHPRDIPSVRQAQSLKYELQHSDFPSTDTYKNLLSLASGSFLQVKNQHPQEIIFLQLPEQKELMLLYGDQLQLDTTYGRIHAQRKLTSILVNVEGFGFPVGYLIHEDKKKATYNKMWTICRELSALPPVTTFVYGDFSKAISGSVADSLPSAQYRGDPFHLMSANFRNLKKHTATMSNYHRLQPLLRDSLRSLSLAPNQQALNESIALFSCFWRIENAAFEVYFRCMWLQEWAPIYWAGCYLPEGIQRGNIHCEPWHNIVRQIAYNGSSSRNMRIEVFAKELLKQTQAMLKEFSTPALLARRLKEASYHRAKYTTREPVLTTAQWFVQQLQQEPHLVQAFQNELYHAEKAKSADFDAIQKLAVLYQQSPLLSLQARITPITPLVRFSPTGLGMDAGTTPAPAAASQSLTPTSQTPATSSSTLPVPQTPLPDTPRTPPPVPLPIPAGSTQAVGSSAVVEALARAQLPPSVLRAAVFAAGGISALTHTPALEVPSPRVPQLQVPLSATPRPLKRHKNNHHPGEVCNCDPNMVRNQACSLQLCMSCCARAAGSPNCRLSSHKAARDHHSDEKIKYFDDAILAAIRNDQARSVVWISYNKGSEGLLPRPVRVLRWEKHGEHIKAECLKKNNGIEQTFKLEHILKWSDKQWTTTDYL